MNQPGHACAHTGKAERDDGGAQRHRHVASRSPIHPPVTLTGVDPVGEGTLPQPDESAPLRRIARVASQRVVLEDLNENEAYAVRILDPHLDEPPRFPSRRAQYRNSRGER